MTKFIELKGIIYNINQIKSVRRRYFKTGSEGHGCETVVDFINDDDASVTIPGEASCFDKLQAGGADIIPAQPGFTMLSYHDGYGDDEAYVKKLPVIAWSIDAIDIAGYGTRPVTSAGVATWSDTPWGIMQPDGSVVCANMDWPDFDAWLIEQKRDEQRRKSIVEKRIAAST